jgi:CRISPR type III-A-associated RAMP protein Csm5
MATTIYTLTCLTPVHVGTGVQFSKFDGAYHDRQWHVIDLDKVLASGADANTLARAMNSRTFSWADWLVHQHMTPTAGALYVLPCPQDPEDTPLREAMKSVYQQPYLPGTSVKGAIRTAVLCSLLDSQRSHQTFVEAYLALCLRGRDIYQRLETRRAFDRSDVHREVLAQTLGVSTEQARQYQQTLYDILNIREERLGEARTWHNFQRGLRNLGRSREWLGQHVEHMVLGHNPNHDLMRAVQVSDTAPVALERLAVGLVWTYTLRGNRLVEKREQDGEYKALVEWLTPDTTLRLALRLDDFLLTDAARELRFRSPQTQAVQQLAYTCNAYARSIIMAEREFYATYGPDSLRALYVELEVILSALPDGAFLLNIGWGGGWEVKTIGDVLRKALGADGFRQLRQRYRLGVAPRTGQLPLNAPFPKTRRIAYEDGAPRWALGWVKVELHAESEKRSS